MTQAADWLDVPATGPAKTVEPDWLSLDDVEAKLPGYLKIPELDAPGNGIQVQRADAAEKDIRFQVMAGTERVWACNGRYVACRPSGFHSDTRRRHQRFLASGHYKHVGTFDDVQLFELQPSSPFYREPGDVRAGQFYEVLRAAAVAAVKRDWGAYVDLLEEIAVRVKSTAALRDTQGGSDSNWALDAFHNVLEHLEQLIFMRWTHKETLVEDKDYRQGMKAMTYGMAFQRMQFEIDRGVREIRIARGEKPSSMVAVRQGPMIIR